MTEESDIDKIAEEIGEIVEERDTEKDNKEIKNFDLEEHKRNIEEYEGGW